MYETYYFYSLRCNFCGTQLEDDDNPFGDLVQARKVARQDHRWMYLKDKDICKMCVIYAVEDAINLKEKKE